jgi:hypothetical protein
VWSVTGTTIVTSFKVFTGANFQIPAITMATFDTMGTDNGVAAISGQGSIMAMIVQNGSGLAGATAVTTPASMYQAFYDSTPSTTTWSQTATGGFGTAWVPGAIVGSTTLTVTPPGVGATVISVAAIPVSDGAVTYVTIIVP